MIPFKCAIDLSKFVNGRNIAGDFSYIAEVDEVGEFKETVVLLDVDFDGIQRYCSCYAPEYEFVIKSFSKARQYAIH